MPYCDKIKVAGVGSRRTFAGGGSGVLSGAAAAFYALTLLSHTISAADFIGHSIWKRI